MLILFSHLLNNLGYVIAIAFFLSKLKIFQKIMQKDNFSLYDKLFLSLIFGTMAIIGTYVGVDYKGAIANTRNIGVVVAGLLGGPLVGMLAGIMAGLHRILIDIGGITSIPCGIATIIGGFIGGYFYKKSNLQNRYIYGFIGGFLVENISMAFILILSKPFEKAFDIVRNIYVPMVFANAVGVSVIILITESIKKEKDRVAGEQAKLALEIANKTLPYFRELNNSSLRKVCATVLNSLNADLVVITDKENILSYFSKKDEFTITHQKILSKATKDVLYTGKTLICDRKEDMINFIYNEKHLKSIKSAIISPLKSENQIIGTIKIYFSSEKQMTEKQKYLVEGLSNLISTQMEISKLENVKKTAKTAEIKALQAQINPHFLFNALNTIASFVRINPEKAREIIINLSTYFRYNIEAGEKFVKISKEIEHVKSYVNIEKARFGNRLNIIYEIDESILNKEIPAFTIQPLVENAIKHGIIESGIGDTVWVYIKDKKDKIYIEVTDNGVGIKKEIIEKIHNNNIESSKIGLNNVYHRLKLIYDNEIEINRLTQGTQIKFEI
ncbi:two-component system LytT family sensor kinase [Hypnocyclicus thermotrophus]|uniref:histidine kinase n=1 Tax=Hypnocyclicus thermotrophus TaxID=1627895 RepID=A0AA46DZ77_9FUSO|nr:sensor histidine kinase [Hypnocyclicus thermotrophus]TDT71588.1 two-component system LytT family sensor kinase [Hypnocyclicus thermotrophus]